MTDARFPERWLNDRRVVRLSDAAYRLFTVSLTWSVANRTDGHLERDDLALMLSVDKSASDELTRCGLWQPDDDGWVIMDFSVTQTSRDQLEGLDLKKAQDRDRAKAYRARKHPESSRLSRDSSRDDIGQDRLGQEGQDRQQSEASETSGYDDAAWLAFAAPCGSCGQVHRNPNSLLCADCLAKARAS